MAHGIELAPGTALEWTLGMPALTVNSLHHQAIERLGDGLVVSAVCPEDGIIEAVEAPRQRFALGVQWHPEAFWRDPSAPSLKLFRALTAAASGRVPIAAAREARA